MKNLLKSVWQGLTTMAEIIAESKKEQIRRGVWYY
jgi:hypothetical protein